MKNKIVKNKKNKSKFEVKGKDFWKKIKNLIKEGNIRKITITSKEGKNIVVLPLTLGVIGVLFAPVLAAFGAIAALVFDCSIRIEK